MKKGKIYIVGAHSRGRTLKAYLEYLYPDVRAEAFLVDDMTENPESADGIPVELIRKGLHTDYPVYLATRGIYHQKLAESLRRVGMQEIIPVTVELDRKLRNAYVRSRREEEGKAFRMIDSLPAGGVGKACGFLTDERGKTDSGFAGSREETDGRLVCGQGETGSAPVCEQKATDMFLPDRCEKTAAIYVAHSVFDQPLQTPYRLAEKERILQVGAALTDKRLSSKGLTDCEGENISARNRQYCELTGLYWIWKHAREDYVGLVHYRRHFLLPPDWAERMEENRIDVLLPVPLYVAPDIAGNYRERHIASDWDFLMEYFKKELPEEYRDAEHFFKGNLYSPCNMLIARREVLARLCGWLFPILDAVVSCGGEKKEPYMNRYPGFISERLITYFFERDANGYQVAYADKNFLA